jgi:hypothetical protein
LRFSTYATYWVRNALTMTIRDTTRTIRLPQRLQLTYSKINRATEELRAASNWEPTDEEVAGRVGGITPEKVREVRAQIKTRAGSLDAIIGEDRALGEMIPDARQHVESFIVQVGLMPGASRTRMQTRAPSPIPPGPKSHSCTHTHARAPLLTLTGTNPPFRIHTRTLSL